MNYNSTNYFCHKKKNFFFQHKIIGTFNSLFIFCFLFGYFIIFFLLATRLFLELFIWFFESHKSRGTTRRVGIDAAVRCILCLTKSLVSSSVSRVRADGENRKDKKPYNYARSVTSDSKHSADRPIILEKRHKQIPLKRHQYINYLRLEWFFYDSTS